MHYLKYLIPLLLAVGQVHALPWAGTINELTSSKTNVTILPTTAPATKKTHHAANGRVHAVMTDTDTAEETDPATDTDTATETDTATKSDPVTETETMTSPETATRTAPDPTGTDTDATATDTRTVVHTSSGPGTTPPATRHSISTHHSLSAHRTHTHSSHASSAATTTPTGSWTTPLYISTFPPGPTPPMNTSNVGPAPLRTSLIGSATGSLNPAESARPRNAAKMGIAVDSRVSAAAAALAAVVVLFGL